MRSLSKCFDPPLDEAVVDEDGIAAKTKAGKGEFAKCRLCCVLPSSCGYGYDDLYSLAVIITSMLSSYYVSSCGSVLCFHYVIHYHDLSYLCDFITSHVLPTPIAQQQWGPSNSISDDEDNQNKKPPVSPGSAGNQLFKVSPKQQTPESKSSSNHTHPTVPTSTTVGGNSQSTTANTNAAKATAGSGSFWNFRVRAADSSSESLHATSSTFSNPAKAAADAASAVMMGMISRANGFSCSSSSSQSNKNMVTPSPQKKKSSMEGIPEDKTCGDVWGGFCVTNDNACFTDFGFNPFSGDNDDAAVVNGVGGNDVETAPPQDISPIGTKNEEEAKWKDGEVVTDDVDEVVNSKLGFGYIEVPPPGEIERSVSELTMRSIGAHARDSKALDTRRMAYYAVGRAGDGKSSGNRRCYFTGTAIPYSTPFYAGCVQQGPRTLVVFCLPSALGFPVMSSNSQTKEERERYLQSLPTPDAQLLNEMRKRYSEPFETLPSQVRSPLCWQLFVKFCFFSGLPIAEGEMHYRVKSSVNVVAASSTASNSIPEEISLSHEVMETVNGKVSAEILRLPNQKTFDYIRTQYSQQSAKLNAEVFNRNSWEMVMPEV